MRLKNGKDFFAMGNGFILQDPALNLVDLPLGMVQVIIEIRQQRRRYAVVVMQPLPGGAGPLHIDFSLVEVGLISGFYVFLFGQLFGFVLRSGVFEFLNQPIAFFETPQVIGALAPFGQT